LLMLEINMMLDLNMEVRFLHLKIIYTIGSNVDTRLAF